MAPPTSPHADLGGYVLEALEPDDRAEFERHLGECATCPAELRELGTIADLLTSAAPAYDVPPALESRVLSAVERAADEEHPTMERARFGRFSAEPRRRRRFSLPGRLALAGAAASVLAAAVLAGERLGNEDLPGTPELEAVLTAPEDAGQATASVRETGLGRVILFTSDDLPVLPEGELYELWFVGPGDTLEDPNRISAGTFHPDEEGRSEVRLHAAVDPAKYPTLSVTAEPGDGMPQRTGPEVLRSEPAA